MIVLVCALARRRTEKGARYPGKWTLHLFLLLRVMMQCSLKHEERITPLFWPLGSVWTWWCSVDSRYLLRGACLFASPVYSTPIKTLAVKKTFCEACDLPLFLTLCHWSVYCMFCALVFDIFVTHNGKERWNKRQFTLNFHSNKITLMMLLYSLLFFAHIILLTVVCLVFQTLKEMIV